jgi:hypothetical protein
VRVADVPQRLGSKHLEPPSLTVLSNPDGV